MLKLSDADLALLYDDPRLDADRAADRTAHGAPSDASPADVVRAWGPEQWAPILDRAVRAAAITVSRPGANPRRRPNWADRRTPGRRVQRARMGRRKAVGYPVKP